MELVVKLRGYFKDRSDVEVAYLFGSHASGSQGPLSDVDVAVVFKKSMTGKRRFKAVLELTGDMLELLNSEHVDVVDLDGANLLFKSNVIKNGLVVKDNPVRPYMEYLIIDDYLDRRHYDLLHAEKFLGKVTSGGLT
ncbi:MAG: nucleotidyltransferase domain-containing protein [Candidatus Altiarchaeota archaeon]